MKKLLLTSALILSIAVLAPASVLGEENTTQSTSAVKESIAKEEKKESSVAVSYTHLPMMDKRV